MAFFDMKISQTSILFYLQISQDISKRKWKREGVWENAPPTFSLAYAATKSTISWSTIAQPMLEARAYPVLEPKPTDEPTNSSSPTAVPWQSVSHRAMRQLA